jgi:hypothetical protein
MEDIRRRRREAGIVFHILSRVSLRRIRDRMAEALCICRRLRSRAVMGFELLLFDNPDDFDAVLELVLELPFVNRRRVGASGTASASLGGLMSTCARAGRRVGWGEMGLRGLGVYAVDAGV